jgi:hypothetical protein
LVANAFLDIARPAVERLGRARPALPDNDFAVLFRVLAEDPESYQRGDPMVFASAIGRSFYEQLLPAASVMLWTAPILRHRRAIRWLR